MMITRQLQSLRLNLKYSRLITGLVLGASAVSLGVPAAVAQQVGAVNGYVTDGSGSPAAGVSVVATSPVLPSSRSTVTSASGRYQLPALPPGDYLLTFTDSNGNVQTREIPVLLSQNLNIDVTFGDEVVVVSRKIVVDSGAGSLKNTIGVEAITSVPVGQEYRDLQKLIPGVQYSEDSVRGPSAGGSGQDNGYKFDGVDVSLPLFGNLSAEPSTHDVAQVSVIRGGAQAKGFLRTGGFQINTTSKRGTNEFTGELGYRFQLSDFSAEPVTGPVTSETDRDWLTLGVGGPIIEDKLFFYASYYRPTVTSENRENVYGPVGDFESVRNEYFLKLTAAPTDKMLFDVSYRTSDRQGENQSVGGFEAASLSTSGEAQFNLFIAEGSFILDDTTTFGFKYTDFENKTAGVPDTLFDLQIRDGGSLDVANLGSIGRLNVPTLDAGDAAQNAFVQPIIDQFGYLDENGVRQGGGSVGGDSTINRQDFFRNNFEIFADKTFEWGEFVHDFHIGYQYQEVEENLARTSNGYGVIDVPAGTINATDGVTPVFYQVRLSQTSILNANGDRTLAPPSIDSRSTLESFEFNDTISYRDWTFDVGFMLSKDVLYGQGLIPTAGTLSGFSLSPGTEYKMYTVDWDKMFQPRLGVRYDYSDSDSFYANYARYNPPASSLARAASWDRNINRDIRINYDANGDFIDIDPVRSSSGKFFVEDMDPRYIDEYLIGWDKRVNEKLTTRLHARHRYASNFWEDTPNTARLSPLAPPEIQALGPYIPNLADVRAEIGGSSYVIALLDTAYTEYWEAGVEAEYRDDNWYLQGSYVWSSYEGNFDQDNSTTTNDANTFIGSSFIADGIGRQVWNNRDGTLRGDRPHQFKLFGFYDFSWNGRAGFYTIYQSGQPWEAWSYEPYRPFYGGFSSTSRYAEPAGSRRSPDHYQLDLSYTQTFDVWDGREIELRADLFNVFDKQTGYNYNPFLLTPQQFGRPRSYYNPRRLQLAINARF